VWRLKRTVQCKACPWRQDVDPHTIPHGYSVERHAALRSTIATPADVTALTPGTPLHVMACHETEAAHCVGWLMHQLGPGNNLALRILALTCTNIGQVRLCGPQHATFDDTLPREGCEGSPLSTRPSPGGPDA
jgi:Family of unknown function (DUF6283)